MRPRDWAPADMGAAAAEWLSGALLPGGRDAWRVDRPAAAFTGILFDAVQIPRGAVRGQDRGEVESCFQQADVDGAVIADPFHTIYYALVAPGASQGWDLYEFPCFGPSHSIPMPPPHRADPPGVHWVLSPPDGPETLCEVEWVLELIAQMSAS
ncbi:hypothetical protein [Streptomyces aureoversilis]|uniref:Uncharacterized protein n=1 Tax=Streptomyces aureoversilis TaxID=67277 RepID=A0ABV9ZVQ3_9ACTN